jgi:transmembrane sensor
MADHSKFLLLCAKSLSGELTSQEGVELERWLAQSPENRKAFDESAIVWQAAEPGPIPTMPDIQTEWRFLEKSLGIASEKSESRTETFFGVLKRALGFGTARGRAVAISLASLLVVIAATWIWNNYELKNSMAVVQTANSEQVRVVLPDGSSVRLNSGSNLQYPKRFSGDVRRVTLTGEAFFEVKHDGKTFEVVTDNAVTTVLGTRFDVRARDGQTRVIVEDGRVRFGRLGSEGGVVLTKGEMSSISPDAGPSAPSPVNTDRLLSWLSGRLVFEKTPLSEIIGELERKFGVSITVADGELGRKTVTAEYDNPSIETVLTSLCTALNVKCRVDTGKYVIQNE